MPVTALAWRLERASSARRTASFAAAVLYLHLTVDAEHRLRLARL